MTGTPPHEEDQVLHPASPRARGVACLVLAAGLGTRMRPFTNVTPKPLLTVNNEELLARAINLGTAAADRVAVNAFHLAEQIIQFVEPLSIHVSLEPRLLGTAGAIGQLKRWLDDDDLLILNGDTWLGGLPEAFVAEWDRLSPRLLVKDVTHASDFGTMRFVGASLLPNSLALQLKAEPSGLYEEVWRTRHDSLDLHVTETMAFDCGTPMEFLHANLAVSGLPAVIHPSAHPGGVVVDSVFLKDSSSPPGSVCIGEIRDGAGNTYIANDTISRDSAE